MINLCEIVSVIVVCKYVYLILLAACRGGYVSTIDGNACWVIRLY